MKHSHYGIELDTDKPTTGVYSIHDTQWLQDEAEIDPAFGKYCPICGDELHDHCSRCDFPNDKDGWDTVPWEPTTLLYGAWIQEKDGRFAPDTSGEYAAIHNVNSSTVQVIHSQHIRYGIMCSPCYPGQVDASVDDPDVPDATHKQAYYTLPTALLRK